MPLTPTELATLQCLVENAGKVVSKQELREFVWPDQRFLSDSNLVQHIRALRRKLGDDPEGISFIKTASGEGYYLTVPVTIVPEIEAEAPEILPPRPPFFSRKRLLWSIGAVLLTVFAGVGYLRARGDGLRVTGYHQLTNDGLPKYGPLLSDGNRVYFQEQIDGQWKVVSVPISGGDISPLAMPDRIVRLFDIAVDGSALLLSIDGSGGETLWSWPLNRGSLQVIPKEGEHAGWAPDRGMIAFGENASLIIARSGGARSELAVSQFGHVLNPHWSPDGARISFTLKDTKNDVHSLWQVDSRGKHWERMAQTAGSGDDQANGTWTADGRYFVYEAGSIQRHDLWVIPGSDRPFASYFSKASRLTNGPGNWNWPMPAKAGDQILALGGSSVRGELARLDPQTQVWQPYLGGISAYEIDFSRDGKWITYTRFPEHTIWKAKTDGSERVQLTPSAFDAHQPHWSPDGSRIAFMAQKPGKPWRVVTLEVAAGAIAEPVPEGDDQGVPTWSKDGHSLVFGEWLFTKDLTSMRIHLFDEQTRRVSALPGSANLWSPRWSPDGVYISALRPDRTALLLVRCCSSEWKTILKGDALDDPMWSPNSKYIFLMGRVGSPRMKLLRITVPDGRVEEIVDIQDFPATNEQWFGLAPDGSALGLRGVRVQEIYALECKLP